MTSDAVRQQQCRARRNQGRRLVACRIEVLPGVVALKLEVDEAEAELFLVDGKHLPAYASDDPALVDEAIAALLVSRCDKAPPEDV